MGDNKVDNSEWEEEVDDWLQQLQLIDRIISHKYEVTIR